MSTTPTVPKRPSNGCAVAFGIVAALFIGGVIVAEAVKKPPTAEEKAQAARDADPTISHMISPDFAAIYVAPHLKDPDSAKFRNTTMRQRHGLPVICGGVNARNSFGGYTGFQQFIMVGTMVTLSEGVPHSKWAKLWKGYCEDTDATDVASANARKSGKRGR